MQTKTFTPQHFYMQNKENINSSPVRQGKQQAGQKSSG
jgi:hypothetical protein